MQTKIVVGGIVEYNGKIVLVKEGKKDIKGLWNLPVGGLEELETILDGAQREIEEETCFRVDMKHLVGVYQNPDRDGVNVIKFIFAAAVVSGELACPADLMEAKLMSRDDIAKLSDKELRDASIRMALTDYFNGKKLPLDSFKHYS